VAAFAVCTLLAGIAVGQVAPNVQRIRPQDYQSVEQPRTPRPGGPVEMPEPQINLPDDTTPLVDSLKAVVFVPNQQAVTARPDASGLVFEDLPLLDTPQFRAEIEPYLGQPLTWQAIGEMVKKTILYYRSKDRPVVDVIVPEQEVTGGVLQLLVIEAVVGDVRVEGNNWFSDELIRQKVRLQPGDRIRSSQLLEDIDFLNTNPFMFVRPVLTPGEEVGQTDVLLQTNDRFPYRFYAGYEDTGSRLTGLGRYLFGVNAGNLWGLGHEAGYQYATNDKFTDDINVHSAYYRIPLPNRTKLAFYGSMACYDARHEGLDVTGNTWQVSTRYMIPLPVWLEGRYRHEVEVGFDFKRVNNGLDFVGFDIYDGTVDTTQFAGQYAASIEDGLGTTAVTWRGYWQPGSISSKAQKSDYNKARIGADPQYFYTNLSLERIWDLPLGASLVNRFIGQLSTDRLLPTEQLGFGGYDTIRGFDMREVNADTGVIVSVELRSPEISVWKIAGKPDLDNKVQFLTFWDYGNAVNKDTYPGENKSNQLQSVGVGMRYRLGNYVSFRMDYGWRLSNPHNTTFNDNGRFHIGVLVAY
jgi:hemolysin activation/secretion protein